MTGVESDIYDRRWRIWVAIFWIAAAALLLYGRWAYVGWFALGDTDDNLRIMQVRALLAGQDWFDLRQYRLDPPFGANVHWSRIVDLPIATLMLALRPLVGGPWAEKLAVAVAPMLPMAIVFASITLTCRRLISSRAFPLAIAFLLCAHSARSMWAPLRIDHHGWQLAMLSLIMLGLTDPRRARGGLIIGLASAVSLSIGLELLIYLAAAGGVVALMWIVDEAGGKRLVTYGAALAGGCALGYLLFASYDNRSAVCDAFSPVWLSAMVGAGAIAVLLPLLPLRTWPMRLAAGAALGALLAVGFALLWPHCLGRLEGVSPELEKLWLSHVREARPIYRHNWQTMMNSISLPVAGLAGYAVMLWRLRRDRTAFTPWAALAALAVIAAGLLLWQSRAGPAAQLLSIPAVTGLAWLLIGWFRRRWNVPVATVGTVAIFLLLSGIGAQFIAGQIRQTTTKGQQAVNRANGRCPTLAALRPIARQPKGYVLTFVDLNPRLIAVTHHDAVAGPYHRNQAAILDVMRSFRGTAENARRTIERRGIDYVLICPGLSESTIYAAEAPKGFYVQLSKGRVPDWLIPITLPEDSPYRMWRVVRSGSSR